MNTYPTPTLCFLAAQQPPIRRGAPRLECKQENMDNLSMINSETDTLSVQEMFMFETYSTRGAYIAAGCSPSKNTSCVQPATGALLAQARAQIASD